MTEYLFWVLVAFAAVVVFGNILFGKPATGGFKQIPESVPLAAIKGSTGTLLTNTDKQRGLVSVEVVDEHGIAQVARVSARSDDYLDQGDRVVVTHFDPKSSVARVERFL